MTALFPEHDHSRAHDDLDRFYTPDRLALALLERLARCSPTPRSILEPSVGGGAFVRAARQVWPGASITGCDLDRRARGLELCDEAVVGAFEYAADLERHDLVVGNPPFGEIEDHLPRARALGATVALILPWSLLGGVERWEALLAEVGRPTDVWPVLGRPWTQNVRETAAYVWRPGRSMTALGAPLRWRTP